MSNLPSHSETLHIRLTAADRATITARATRASLTVSEYMRRAGLGMLEPITGRPSVIQEKSVNLLPPKSVNPVARFLSSAGGDDPA